MLTLTPELAGIAVVAVLGFWILGAHNRLVCLRQGVRSAFGRVDAHLRQRHDLLAELITAASPLRDEAPEVLDAVEAARQEARAAADQVAQRTLHADRLTRLVLAEKGLRIEVSRLIALAKADAGLRADARLRGAMKALSATQHRLSAARDAFNLAAGDLNRNVQQFPTRLVAAMFRFGEAGEL